MSRIKREQPKQTPLPRIGHIKIGEKSDKGFPTSLDYFKATGKYAHLFHKEYGQKPQQIQVIFVTDDVDTSCNEEYQLRDNDGRLFAKGDGEVFRVWNKDQNDYSTVSIEKAPDIMNRAVRASGSKKGWEIVLTLRFIIPRITGVAGLWQLQTKGEASSVPSIREAFDFVLDRAGTVINIPFDLEVEKVKSQRPGSKSIFPVIRLIPNVGEENMEVVRNFLQSGHDKKEVKQLLSDNQKQVEE